MPGLNTSIQITDRLSPAFRTMTQSINVCLGAFADMQTATGQAVNTDAIRAAQVAMNDMNMETSRIDDELRKAATAQHQFNDSVRTGHTAAEELLGKVKAVVGAYVGMRAVSGVIGLSDEMAQTAARLNLMNDGLQTTAELQEKIYMSAQNSRASYMDTAAAVSRMGMLAKDAFSGNDELIQFTELMNKNLKVGGASAQEQASAMYQLTQAMASGRLQGDEYRSIIENAPLLASAIEDYMVNVQHAQGSMKDWASEGLLTAGVIKAAMFNAADETNAKFEEIPMTWSDVANSVKNTGVMAFQPILQQINQIANNANIQTVVQGIVGGMATIAAAVGPVLNLMVDGAGWVVENWSIISPIILGAALAFGVYEVATNASVVATKIFTAAQSGLSAVLAMNPIGLVVIGVIALISAIYAGVAAFNKFTNSSVSATGIIAGAFTTLFAHVYNTWFVPTWNIFASVANFIGNVFNDPVAAIKVLFYDVSQTVVGYILNMANAIESVINKIPGVEVNITAGLDSFYNKIGEASQKVKDASGWKEYVQTKEYMDYTTAASAGYNFGKGVADKVSEKFNEFKNFGDNLGNYDTATNTALTAANTGKIADSTEISSEDLKYLRDIAERDIIDRTVFRDIKVDLGGVINQVNEMSDLDGIAAYIGESVRREMLISAEGVH
ncbi:MAG: tape measure protein [Acetivibrio ethanolgignens]